MTISGIYKVGIKNLSQEIDSDKRKRAATISGAKQMPFRLCEFFGSQGSLVGEL